MASLGKLYNRKKESDVFDVLSNICDLDNLMDSRHHPVEMARGCEGFMEGWEQSLEEFLMNR